MTKINVPEQGGPIPATAPKPASIPEGKTAAQWVQEDERKTAVVVDLIGRRFTLRKPSLLEQMRVIKALGGETSLNGAYMMLLTPLLHIVAIDDDPRPLPSTALEVDALIEEVGETSFNQIAAKQAEMEIETQVVRETLKNLQGTAV